MTFLAAKNSVWRKGLRVILCVLLLSVCSVLHAQTASAANVSNDLEDDFRTETISVRNGAEIVTIFVRMKGAEAFGEKADFVPLVSVLRDTLGDDIKENDLLRQVWLHSYTRPSLTQRITAGVPFLYRRTANKNPLERTAPAPAIADLHPTKKDIWNRVFWFALRNFIVNDLTLPTRSAVLQYQNNARNYRRASVASALAVLKLFEKVEGEKLLSDTELKDMQARLMLSEKVFGSMMKDENLHRVFQARSAEQTATRGWNWELLRQYSEKQGLFFEPLTMPDGSATHAIVWTCAEDLTANRGKAFDSRFLNIKNPWRDSRLITPEKYQGYRETRWFDAENRQVPSDTPNASPRTMIPLAVYGLDNPKIPAILIDFRDTHNPKMREMSKRILNDITRNIFSLSRFQSLPYFFGRFIYDLVTLRRGMDFNQETRLRSYSQLKLLLSLDATLDEDFRREIAQRLETVSLNPLQNDIAVEIRLAQKQYENLRRWAEDEKGLAEFVAEQRREEMSRFKHTARQRFLYNLGRTVSLGIYRHREKYTPELVAEMDMRRQLDFHERIVRETARVTAQTEIDGDFEQIRASLEFISQYGQAARPRTARAVARIMQTTADNDLRQKCLAALQGIDNTTAKQLFEKSKKSAADVE